MSDFKYPITEIFSSIQGEGGNVGRSATFIRLGGCNIACPGCDEPLHDNNNTWVRLTAEQIGDHLTGKQKFAFPSDEHFPKKPIVPTELIVLTGGEPTLYPIDDLVAYLGAILELDENWNVLSPADPHYHDNQTFDGPMFCIETNGTRPVTALIDYVCVSPKPENFGRGGTIVKHDLSAIQAAHEIKLVVGWSDAASIDAEIDHFRNLNPTAQIYLSPLTMFPGNVLIPETADQASEAVMRNATKGVRLSVQVHKWLKQR